MDSSRTDVPFGLTVLGTQPEIKTTAVTKIVPANKPENLLFITSCPHTTHP
jgi:hypothetical protein